MHSYNKKKREKNNLYRFLYIFIFIHPSVFRTVGSTQHAYLRIYDKNMNFKFNQFFQTTEAKIIHQRYFSLSYHDIFIF